MLNTVMYDVEQLTIENYMTIEELTKEVSTLEIVFNDGTKRINSYIGYRLVQAIRHLEHGYLWGKWNYFVKVHKNGFTTRIVYTIL